MTMKRFPFIIAESTENPSAFSAKTCSAPSESIWKISLFFDEAKTRPLLFRRTNIGWRDSFFNEITSGDASARVLNL